MAAKIPCRDRREQNDALVDGEVSKPDCIETRTQYPHLFVQVVSVATSFAPSWKTSLFTRKTLAFDNHLHIFATLQG